MKILRRYFKIFTTLSIVLLCSIVLFMDPVDANSGEIDSVIIEMKDSQLVELEIDEYIDLYLRENGNLHDFIINEDGFMDVIGVKSGDKYIDIDEYVDNYLIYGDDIWKVIELSEPMLEEIVDRVKDISDYKIEIINVKIGEFEGEIRGNNITVSIPEESLDLTIGHIELDFLKQVKIIEVDKEVPWIDIINRFRENGYELSNYYNNYRVRSSWSYSRLFRLQSSTSYTVITEEGYKETFFIKLNIF